MKIEDNLKKIIKHDKDIENLGSQLDNIVQEVDKPITLNKCDSEMLKAIEGGEGASFELLSIPRDKSVDYNKLSTGLSDLFEPKFNSIQFTWRDESGGYFQHGENTDSGWCKSAIPVVEGEKYKITGYQLNNSRLFVLGDENKSYNSQSIMYPAYGQTTSSWTLYKDIEVTIPSGVKYLLISTGDNYKGFSIVKKENEYLNKRAEEVRVELIDELEFLKENTTEYSYVSYTPTWINDKYYNSDNQTVDSVSGWSYVELDVNIGDSFKINGFTNQWFPLYCLVDEDNTIIQINNRTTVLTELYNQIVTVKKDNCKLYINSRGTTTTVFKNNGILSKAQDDILSLKAENNALKKRISEEQIKNDFDWKPLDKIYITFSFDDTLEDISDIVTLFKSKNVPVCLATIYSRLGIITNSGKSALDICKECEENGGEILSHYSYPLTSTKTDAEYKVSIVDTYIELTRKGLNVDGIITTGGVDSEGNGWQTGDFKKCVELMRPYYRYSDLYGYNTGVIQYHHQRKFLTTNDTTNKGFIDTAISQGNQWISFASHGKGDNVTISLLSSLLDYIATKNNVEIVTFRELHDRFGTTKIEKRLLALESN